MRRERIYGERVVGRARGMEKLEAASGFEPLHRGFADLSLNHLGTPPSKQ